MTSPSFDRTLTSRYECKYIVSPGLLPTLRRFIAPFVTLDRYSLVAPDHRYVISSLYLDSADFALLRATVHGEKTRFKLRVRSYSDDPASPVFSEVKARMNGIVTKARAPMPKSEAAELVVGFTPQTRSRDHAAVADFMEKRARIAAAPVLCVRYEREAYEGLDSAPLRVTFDSELSYSLTTSPQTRLGGDGWMPIRLPGVVLEFKFTERLPSWGLALVRQFELQRESVAKYVLCVEDARRRGMLGHRRVETEGARRAPDLVPKVASRTEVLAEHG